MCIDYLHPHLLRYLETWELLPADASNVSCHSHTEMFYQQIMFLVGCSEDAHAIYTVAARSIEP
jgi:hypothetical protein